jgi:hypothetical protein
MQVVSVRQSLFIRRVYSGAIKMTTDKILLYQVGESDLFLEFLLKNAKLQLQVVRFRSGDYCNVTFRTSLF